jgi:hypothetical protein
MRTLAWVLIALSALGFVLAVVGSQVSWILFGVTSEGYSRACTNLALLAIALLMISGKKSAGE